MSLLGYASKVLTLRPTVIKAPGTLVIKNGFITRLLTLFLFLRKVEIIYDDQTIFYDVTWFYLFNKTKLLDFNELLHIDYSFHSMGTSWAGVLLRFRRLNQVESYKISLVTKKKEKYVICSFRGEGAVATGWIGLLFGDDILDLSGTQESDSRQFVSYLAQLLGIPIGEQYNFSRLETECPSCGRRISQSTLKCIYCGSAVAHNS